MRFVLDLWPDEGDGQLTAAQLVKGAIESVRDHGEDLAWGVQADNGELIAEVTPDDLAKLKQVLVWESAGTDEPGDQNASTQLVPHGFWSLGPAGSDEAGIDRGWGVELIEQDEHLTEIGGGGVHLGHFDSEDAAKQAADDYEKEHRARRKVFVVPISVHVEGFSAEGAVTKVWENLNDAAGATITTGGSQFEVIYINTPMNAKEGAAPTSYSYDLDGDGTVRE